MNEVLVIIAPPFAHHELLLEWLAEAHGFVLWRMQDEILRASEGNGPFAEHLAEVRAGDRHMDEQMTAELLRKFLAHHSGERLVFENFPRSGDQLRLFEEILAGFGRNDCKFLLCEIPDPDLAAESQALGEEAWVAERVMEAIQRFEDKNGPFLRFLLENKRLVSLDVQRTGEEVIKELAAKLEVWFSTHN